LEGFQLGISQGEFRLVRLRSLPMAYPNRTYATVTHAGASATSKFLDTPVNGGTNGSATAGKVKFIESFVATEATGVGTVETNA
jgi:hypothetical protein